MKSGEPGIYRLLLAFLNTIWSDILLEVHCPKYVGKMHPSSLASISKREVEKLSSLDVPSQTLLAKAIGQCCRDACLCSCSKEGCSPATIMWQSLFERWKYTLFCHIPFLRHYVLDWFEDVSAENELELPSQFRADVIRFETFEALGLSHLCCNQGSWLGNEPFTAQYDPSEVAEMLEEEQELIEEHERLVDMFIEAYESEGESLSSFLGGYWRTNMAKVLMGRRPPAQEQLANLRELRVIIKDDSRFGAHYIVDQDLQANQDVDSHNHGPTDDTGSEERISDKAWYRILGEYHGWRKSWCIFLDDSNDEEG